MYCNCKYLQIDINQMEYCSKYKDTIICISFESNCEKCNLNKDNDGFPCCEKCKDYPKRNFWDTLRLIYQFAKSEFYDLFELYKK
jgi:hypothetical protein